VVKKITYYNSDAWVLLAIIYACKAGEGTLDKIIGAGDAINTAIFLPRELEGGLARLVAGGYVTESNGKFTATEKALDYSASPKKRQAIFNELSDVQTMLAVSFDEPVVISYPGFSEAAFAEAVKKYRQSMGA
jgi:phosphopentomutase